MVHGRFTQCRLERSLVFSLIPRASLHMQVAPGGEASCGLIMSLKGSVEDRCKSGAWESWFCCVEGSMGARRSVCLGVMLYT